MKQSYQLSSGYTAVKIKPSNYKYSLMTTIGKASKAMTWYVALFG